MQIKNIGSCLLSFLCDSKEKHFLKMPYIAGKNFNIPIILFIKNVIIKPIAPIIKAYSI